MPRWDIRCECGGTVSQLTRLSTREEQGGRVACADCGELNDPRPTAPNLFGLGREQGADGEVSTAELHRAEKAGKQILTPNSPERKAQYDRALERANQQAQKFGYKDVFEKRERFKGDEARRWNTDQVAKQVEKYHKKHGNAGKQTVEQAAQQILGGNRG